MAQMEVETQPFDGAVHGTGRFACPSCGSNLRTGAILCPECGADLWRWRHGSPESSGDPDPVAEIRDASVDPDPVEDARDDFAEWIPIPAGPGARRSLIVAAVALAARVVLSLVAASDGRSWGWWLLVGGVSALAAYSIRLAGPAARRVGGARGRRAPFAARYGFVLGMATLAYTAAVVIAASLDRLIGPLPR